jgi:type II secretory pathway component PulJ
MKGSFSRHASHGYLLSEMMISIGIFSAVSVGLLMGFVSLERNFMATTDFATNHTDALRISDYLALDLRRALSVTTAQNDTTITIPSYYNADGQPQMPTLNGEGGVNYGSSGSSVQIRYYLLGGSIYRQEGASPAVAIADNVQDFLFSVTDSGKVVTTKVTFSPRFRSGTATADAIAATAIYNTTLLRNSRTDTTSSVY